MVMLWWGGVKGDVLNILCRQWMERLVVVGQIAADAIMWSSDLHRPLNPCGSLYNGLYLDELCLGLRVGVVGRVSRGQISGIGL